MKVEVEQTSGVEKKVIVTVPAADVKKRLDAEYRLVGRQARIRGFRPGKAPKGLVRKMYRKDVEERIEGSLIQDHLVAAFRESGIDPLAMPGIEKHGLAEGEDYVFEIQCQVRPELTLTGLDEIRVDRGSVEPEPEALQAEIETLREKHAEMEPVEGRGADLGDTATIDFVGRLDGEEEPFEGGTGQGHEIELGSGRLVPGFEDQLIGLKEGDETEVNLTFPDEYHEQLAGKAVTFQVVVQGLHQKVLPAVDDAFAEDCGFDDLSALRASVYDRLADAARDEEDGRLREAVLTQLMEKNPTLVPPALIDEARQRLEQQLRMHMSMSGMQEEMLEQLFEGQADSLQERAREMAARDLLLEQLGGDQGLSISDEALDERVASIAERTGQPKPKVMATLRSGGRLEGLRIEMLHEAAVAWLVEKATGGHEVGEAASQETEGDAAESEGVDSTEAPSDGQDEASIAESETASAEESDG